MNAPLDGFQQEAPSFETLGSLLKRERELRALSLEELSSTTRIPLAALRKIEDDSFEDLPGAVFTRGFVRAYAKALGMDPQPLLVRLDRKQPREPVELVAKGSAPPRSRRFGIAIAVVVLLILFTLALSIVLRPRHRDVPVELSRVGAFDLDHA